MLKNILNPPAECLDPSHDVALVVECLDQPLEALQCSMYIRNHSSHYYYHLNANKVTHKCSSEALLVGHQHWRRPVKNIGGNHNIEGQKVAITAKSMAFLNYSGAHARAAPQVYAYGHQ